MDIELVVGNFGSLYLSMHFQNPISGRFMTSVNISFQFLFSYLVSQFIYDANYKYFILLSHNMQNILYSFTCAT